MPGPSLASRPPVEVERFELPDVLPAYAGHYREAPCGKLVLINNRDQAMRALTLALREALRQAGTIVLEPVMNLEVRVPEDSLGAVMKDLGARRVEIRETDILESFSIVRGMAPLAEMFGYSTQLRSITQGRGSFSMELFDYQPAK